MWVLSWKDCDGSGYRWKLSERRVGLEVGWSVGRRERVSLSW